MIDTDVIGGIIVFGLVMLGLAILGLTPVILSYLWNSVIAPIWEWPEIYGYWKWWGILIFFNAVFGGVHYTSKS